MGNWEKINPYKWGYNPAYNWIRPGPTVDQILMIYPNVMSHR